MKKKLLTFLLLLPLALKAQTFIYDGVYYSIKLFTKNVGVASSNSTMFYKDYITIPEIVKYNDVTYTVTSVENYAFTGSEGLLGVTLPNTVTTIGDGSFSGCHGLTEFIIPQGVSTIGYDAFYGSINIKEITIPNSVKGIMSRAFSKIENLVIEDGEEALSLMTLYNINDNTPFHICPLKSIYLGRNLEYQNSYSPFSDNSLLETVTIGEKVTKLSSYLFRDCTGLKDIYCYNEEVPEVGLYVLASDIAKNVTLHVPANSLEKYKTASFWKEFGTIVSLPNDNSAIENTFISPKTINNYYNIKGQKIGEPQKGINIIRTSDGNYKKILLK